MLSGSISVKAETKSDIDTGNAKDNIGFTDKRLGGETKRGSGDFGRLGR
jgi:hypothetical protein